MRQKMRVTRTISTSVDEKDWKSCCPTCVMQVPPPAPELRTPALLPPLALWEAKVRLRRQGGSASLSSFGALALIGAGLRGDRPTRLPLLDTRFPPAKTRTRAHATQLLPGAGGSEHSSQRLRERLPAGKLARASGPREIVSGPP